MKRVLVVVVLVVAQLSAGPVGPAHAATTVSVSAPQYESPGGTVPTIVTAHDVPDGYSVTIAASGTNGAAVTCVGDVWLNPIRRTASRKCYLHLPSSPGLYNVVGTATFAKPGAATFTASGTGSRAVSADGFASPDPMPLERIQRIERCHNSTDEVWLTFDDGGSAAQVGSILDVLARNNVRGRFFFTGAWAEREPALFQRIKTDGHLVANHTHSHEPLSRTSDGEVVRQIQRGVAATTAPRLLRPPFAAGALTTRLEALAHSQGYALCRWTVDTYDWDGPSTDQMVERITYGDYRSPPIQAGGNILMHGAGTNTAAGLQRIIDAVRSKGLTLEAPTSGAYDPNGPEGTIYRLYRAYFLREPDAGGFQYWNGAYAMGYPLDAISNDFARSDEFRYRYGDVDNGRFLELVYNNVLGRAPDQNGHDYWVDQMNRGMSRGFVMIYFSESEEFRTKTAAGTPPGYT